MRWFFLAAGAVVLAACLYLVWEGVSREPGVEVRGAGYRVVDKVTVLGVEVPTNVTFYVRVGVYNPNLLAIRVRGGDYLVWANGEPFGEGVVPAFEVPAGGSREVESEVSIRPDAGIGGLLDALERGSLNLRVDGEVQAELPFFGVRAYRITKETQTRL
jgi:LEA14-like dessication related protein